MKGTVAISDAKNEGDFIKYRVFSPQLNNQLTDITGPQECKTNKTPFEYTVMVY